MRRMSPALVSLALLVALASPPTASASVGTPEDPPVPTLAHAEDHANPAALAPVISITPEVAVMTADVVGIKLTYVNKASPPFSNTDFATMDRGNEIDTRDTHYMTSTNSNDLAGRYGDMRSRRRLHSAEPIVDSSPS